MGLTRRVWASETSRSLQNKSTHTLLQSKPERSVSTISTSLTIRPWCEGFSPGFSPLAQGTLSGPVQGHVRWWRRSRHSVRK